MAGKTRRAGHAQPLSILSPLISPVPRPSSAASSSTVTTWPAMPASRAQAAMASAQDASGRHRTRARALAPSNQSAWMERQREKKKKDEMGRRACVRVERGTRTQGQSPHSFPYLARRHHVLQEGGPGFRVEAACEKRKEEQRERERERVRMDGWERVGVCQTRTGTHFSLSLFSLLTITGLVPEQGRVIRGVGREEEDLGTI